FPPFASVLLPAVIGPKRTYEMILTGEPLTALEAKELGFVNRVVPEEDLKQAVDEVLNRIVQFSGPVLEMTKKVISSTMGLPVRDAIRKSQDLYLNQLMALEDAQEGIRAVAENRRPVWRNR
ncbi:MAG TPA: enoyl-CoA hydratase-related protein, partial [Candidatus Acidoferrales bacterium]|nr:enoyl-CoA hydratase-related protein [Candidatus Acidoferrales bacterium]